ncbi:MAG TPA: ribosome maturation factor RimP [Geminicoccaceae bacterium]|nr:ribosome maturation factor RimP [Geminicoccaceae bacterium]
MDAIRQITELIEPTVHDLGFEVVRILMTGGQRPTIQVMAERISREPMSVDDCAELSHAISARLDVADPIAGPYRLEVTSPGIDRPLVRRADFERFAGFEVRLETDVPIDGRRRFRGRLVGVVGDDVCLQLPEGERRIPYGAVRRAKLVLTDELLAAAQAERRS